MAENQYSHILSSNFIKKLYYYEEVTSTNDIAKKISSETDAETALVIADYQSAGRGRLGRKWSMSSGKNLMFSILLRPKIDISEIQNITMVMAEAVISAIKRYAPLINNLGIKWPNDCVCGDKKIAGILTESSYLCGEISYIVVGCGINCNENNFECDLENKAASLNQILQDNIKLDILLKYVIEEFEILYKDYLKNGLKNIIQNIRRNSVLIGKYVYLIKGDNKTKVLVKDISEDGKLVVQDSSGNTQYVVSNEVSIRGSDSYI